MVASFLAPIILDGLGLTSGIDMTAGAIETRTVEAVGIDVTGADVTGAEDLAERSICGVMIVEIIRGKL